MAEGPVIGGYLTELQRATADGVPVKGHPTTHAEVERCVLPRSSHPDLFAQAQPGPALGPDGQPILDASGNRVQIFFATEQFNRETTLLYRGPLAAPNNADSPNQWTDFRGSVQLRWPTGTVGVDLRRTASGDRLRIAFDRSAGTRQITAT